MNFALLRQEYLVLQNWLNHEPNNLSALFESATTLPTPTAKVLPARRLKTGPKARRLGPTAGNKKTKADRRAAILQSLRPGAWLSIKEVAKSLPEFSGKTVQRELTDLTTAGLVKKTGERRWSRYSKV